MPNKHVSVLSRRHTHTSVGPQVQQTQQLHTLLGQSAHVWVSICVCFFFKRLNREDGVTHCSYQRIGSKADLNASISIKVRAGE